MLADENVEPIVTDDRFYQLMQYGKIDEINLDSLKVKVDLGGGIKTPFINLAAIAIDFWIPPEKGEQVVVFSPNGEIDAAFALRGIYSSSNTPPLRDDSVWKIEPKKGLSVGLERNGKKISLNCSKFSVKNEKSDLLHLMVQILTEISNSTVSTMLGPQVLSNKSKIDLSIKDLKEFLNESGEPK